MQCPFGKNELAKKAGKGKAPYHIEKRRLLTGTRHRATLKNWITRVTFAMLCLASKRHHERHISYVLPLRSDVFGGVYAMISKRVGLYLLNLAVVSLAGCAAAIGDVSPQAASAPKP